MAIKIFLDTNIILDVFDDKRIFHNDSIALYKLIEDSAVLGFVTESVLTTTDYILQKNLSKKYRQLLFTELNSLLKILPCSRQNFEKALQTNFDDLEDALLYQIALENKIDYYITNDLTVIKKLSNSILPILKPKELLKILA